MTCISDCEVLSLGQRRPGDNTASCVCRRHTRSATRLALRCRAATFGDGDRPGAWLARRRLGGRPPRASGGRLSQRRAGIQPAQLRRLRLECSPADRRGLLAVSRRHVAGVRACNRNAALGSQRGRDVPAPTVRGALRIAFRMLVRSAPCASESRFASLGTTLPCQHRKIPLRTHARRLQGPGSVACASRQRDRR